MTLARDAASARLDVCDAGGRVVATRALGALGAGAHAFTLDARDARGAPLTPGSYVVRVQAGETQLARRWIVLRR